MAVQVSARGPEAQTPVPVHRAVGDFGKATIALAAGQGALAWVRYQLKTPWKNGTTHVDFESVDFIAKLAALMLPPRANLTRFHGVFTPQG